MLVLLVFPVVDKTLHDFEHLNDDRCGIKDTHFCEADHTCSVCDYVFSASAAPPKTEENLIVFSKSSDSYASLCVFNTSVAPKFKVSLRGPPATV